MDGISDPTLSAMLVSRTHPLHPFNVIPIPHYMISLQLCDFGALKQQQQNLKQKHDASSNLHASGRASASPLPGSTSPSRPRPRSQHGNGKAAPSNVHKSASPTKVNASPLARNSETVSPLRLSSPNSPQGLTHKNYKVPPLPPPPPSLT